MTIRPFLLFLCVPLLSSCGRGGGHARTDQVRARSRDAGYTIEAGAGTALEFAQYPESLYAVLIRGAKASVPLRGVFVADAATLAPRADSMAFATIFDSAGNQFGILRFRHTSPSIDTLPIPPGYSPNLSPIAFSPGGTYMAYVQIDSGPLVYGVVRRVADQGVVRKTPQVLGAYETDAQIGIAYWPDSTTFVFGILANGTSDRFYRFRGRIGAGPLVQDTVDGREHPVHDMPPPPSEAPAPSN